MLHLEITIITSSTCKTCSCLIVCPPPFSFLLPLFFCLLLLLEYYYYSILSVGVRVTGHGLNLACLPHQLLFFHKKKHCSIKECSFQTPPDCLQSLVVTNAWANFLCNVDFLTNCDFPSASGKNLICRPPATFCSVCSLLHSWTPATQHQPGHPFLWITCTFIPCVYNKLCQTDSLSWFCVCMLSP